MKSVVTWLRDEIETTDLSTLTSAWGWEDDAEQKVSSATIRRFITSGRPADPKKLKIYLTFLTAVGFLDEQTFILSNKWEAQLDQPHLSGPV